MVGAERILTAIFYATAIVLIVLAGLGVGSAGQELGALEVAAIVLAGVPGGLLLIFSLFGLVSYFVFIPSIKKDGHLFSRVHGTNLLHPLSTSVVLVLLGVGIASGSRPVWGLWGLLFLAYLLETVLIAGRIRSEFLGEQNGGNRAGLPFLLLNLMVGGELVTIAGGARPLPPWRLRSLPEDTWIVDVRTKPEFHWNRLQGAINYPWGEGIIEAAKEKPKDQPVLVTCFSGHRSPAVAVMLRKMGFLSVYNLNWGILYLLLLERGRKSVGPFSLTRPHRDPHRRGEDLKSITRGYVTLLIVALVGAPLEWLLVPRNVPLWQMVGGICLGTVGLTFAIMSFRALGRNFRVYGAPRRSGTLVTTGIYSSVRHPMYTGVIIALAGYVLFFGSVFFASAWFGVTILYLVKAVKEERMLAEKFPRYEGYRERTWRFLPYIN